MNASLMAVRIAEGAMLYSAMMFQELKHMGHDPLNDYIPVLESARDMWATWIDRFPLLVDEALFAHNAIFNRADDIEHST